jgi:subtilisin-like proprotein convertase family protein
MKNNFKLPTILMVSVVPLLLLSNALARKTIITYDSNDVNLPIPDMNTIDSNLFIPDSWTIVDVNVALCILHNWNSDLDVYLIHDGVRVELLTDVGVNVDDFNCIILDDECSIPITAGEPPFIGCYKPEGKLYNFDGLSAKGVWTLEITDDEKGDTGTLISWRLILELSYIEPNNPQPEDGAEDVSAYTCLSWNDPGADPNSTTWDVHISLGKDPNAPAWIIPGLNEPNCCPCSSLCGLETWQEYFWHVVAKDPNYGNRPGPIWSFKTACPVDLNHDGIKDINDVNIFIDKWLEAISCSVPKESESN